MDFRIDDFGLTPDSLMKVHMNWNGCKIFRPADFRGNFRTADFLTSEIRDFFNLPTLIILKYRETACIGVKN